MRSLDRAFRATSILLGSAAIYSLIVTPALAASCGNFSAYWEKLQAAAGDAGEKTSASSLARFPVEVRGTLDDSAATTVDAAGFDARFRGWLDIDPGLSATPTTAADLILGMSAAKAEAELVEEGDEGAEARIGPFYLACSGAEWAITRVYAEE